MAQKPTLNQADFDLLNQLLDKRFSNQQKYIDKRFDILPEQIENIARLVVNEETPKIIEEKIKNIPTKEEYLAGQAKLMGEVKAIREEQSAHMALHDRLEKRVSKVEKKLGLSSVVN